MASLKERFEELIHLPWDEFMVMEKDKNTSVDDMVLCSLIRVCADTDNINATKLSFDRIDEIQEVPIKVNVPKFYIRYPNAKEIETGGEANKQLDAPKEVESEYDPATAKLRATLSEMRKMPRQVVNVVIGTKRALEKGKPIKNVIPSVKAVIVANLLHNAKKGRTRAVEVIFDQIDGKLARTITLLGGNDVYVDDFSTLTAPANAIKDENGVYIAENELMTNAWLRGFANSQKGLEMLAEGLDD